MTLAIAICLFLLLHTYFLYPLLLKLFVDLFGKEPEITPIPDEELPTVSLLFSAYNEEHVLKEKLENTLKLNYPKDKIEVLIGCDGSIDQTPIILKEYEAHFKIFIFKKNRGKAAVLNELQQKSTGDICVFCDANTVFLPNALLMLVKPFRQKKTGCVSGRLLLNDSGRNTLGEGESLYWQIESRIKELEGKLNILMGVNGAIYALRRELYSPIPQQKKVTDDFFVSVHTLMQGFHCLYLKQAIGIETTSKSSFGEFHRKVRIGQANFNFLSSYLRLLNPAKPLIAFAFFSHKLLRWFSPHLLILLFVLSVTSLIFNLNFLALTLLQILFYLLAFLGYIWNKNGRKHKVTTLAYYFVTMNWALLLGFFYSLNEKPGSGGWERIERDEN